MNISAEDIKKLREQTGAGLMDCKRALVEAKGDWDEAIKILRKKGLDIAAKKSSRTTAQGVIGCYVHMDKIGVLVEVDCETDFVAKNEEFKRLVKDIAMHIAASNPLYLSRDEIPEAVIEKETEIYREQMAGKPQHVIDKIIEGKLEKFYTDTCLLDQIFIKDPDHKKKVKDIITDHIAKFGENIVIKRFARFQVGE
ncbi:MAG: translation elongation factor Ts [Nitrospirae bacterium]|nr:MAG: translation elongation factor Ts [Nitrospirota bacterium]